MPKSAIDDSERMNLRVKPEVLEAVERLAAAELRSVNAQVEMLLREALATRGRLKPKGDENA